MIGAQTIELAPNYRISRVIRGGWQLAGGHGAIDRDVAVEDLIATFESGITTFDCADIYTGVEVLFGSFRTRLIDRNGMDAAERLKIHTKLVPDLDILPHLNRAHIRSIIVRSLRNLCVERLDLVQLHWWDYSIEGVLDAFGWLDDLRREGLVRHIGGTNFDTPHLRKILAAGLPLTSLQVQYSVLDQRPANDLAEMCRANRIGLLCYGSVAGGFLSDRWLGARAPIGELENRSLVKYKLIIDDFGGWDLFQSLLGVLRKIAGRHDTDLATIASRYILDRPGVAAVIVGARNHSHVAANANIFAVQLTEADRGEIAAVLAERQGPRGEVYALERDRTGRHGAIMKYNLNAATAS